MPDGQLTPIEFAQKIKAKYPTYKDVDDNELVQKIITKYPQYKSQINFGSAEPKQENNPFLNAQRPQGEISNQQLMQARQGMQAANRRTTEQAVAAQDAEIVKQQQAQKRQEAIKNTVAKFPQYQQEQKTKELNDAVGKGDLIITENNQGLPVLKKPLGFFASFKKAADDALRSHYEDTYLKNLPPEKQAEYLNYKQQYPELFNPESDEAATGLGKIAGENAQMLGEGAIGAMAGGLTGATGGASFGTFLSMANDLATSGYSQTLQKNYYELKQQGFSDKEAIEKAQSNALTGEALALGQGALLSGEIIPKMPKPSVDVKGVVDGIVKSAAHSVKASPKVVGSSALISVINDLNANRIGGDIDLKEMGANAEEAAKQMAVMHFGLWALTEPAKIPSYIRPQIENVVASAPRQEVQNLYQTAEEQGVIPEGTTQKVMRTLSTFDEAKKTVENLPINEEQKAAIAGKIVQRNKIADENKTLKSYGNAFEGRIAENENAISKIDTEIKNLYENKNPFAHEKDSLTGEKVSDAVETIDKDLVSVENPKRTGEQTEENDISVIEPTVRPNENVEVQMPDQINKPETITIGNEEAKTKKPDTETNAVVESERQSTVESGETKENVGESVQPQQEGKRKVETDKAVMEGVDTDYIEDADGNHVNLPQKGYLIDAVFLKNEKEKGKGYGQDLYKKALDEHGVLYSHFPISEDAFRVHEKLIDKGVATSKKITLDDGTELIQLTKNEPKNEAINSPLNTEQNATEIRQEPESNLAEHQNRDGGGETTEAGSRNSDVESRQEQPIAQQPQEEIAAQSGEPPIHPPSTENFVDNPNRRERERGAYTHLMNSDIPEDVKQKFIDKGITYPIAKNESAQKYGRSMIDAYGADDAVKLARQNTFSPSVNSAIYAEAINDAYNAETNAKTNAEKMAAAKKWSDLYNEYAERLTASGQFGQYAYNFYKTSPIGFIMTAKERLETKRDYFLAKDEKGLKEAFDAIKGTPEFKELFSKEVEEAVKKSKGTTKAENKKKISDAFDKLKLDKNNAYATFVPPQIINGAIEAIKQAVLLGFDVVDAINEGVKYINSKHKETWNEDKFKADMKAPVKKIIEGFGVKKPDTTTQEKILAKWEKKLTKLEPEARKQLLQKVLNEVVKNGGLEYDKFKDMYADALGLPKLTPEMEVKLRDLGNKLNQVDIAKENLEKDPTEENIKAFVKASDEGALASRQINDLLGDKGITLDRFLSIAKLNTLGVANLFINPFFNVWFAPVRFLENVVKTGLDYGLKYAGFQREDGIYDNVFFKQRGYFKGQKEGLVKSIKNLKTGDAQFDYFKNPIRQNIQPIESFKDIIAHHKGEKRLTNSEYANAVMEAFPTMGATATIVSRGLQVGDLPFRFAAERAVAENIAKQKGLTGAAKEAFLLNPDEVSAAKIKDAGERAVMSQDNILTGALKTLSAYLGNATKGNPAAKTANAITKIIGATTQPFLKIPLNSAMTAFELAVPEFSLLRAAYHASRGERDAALGAVSRAVVGFALGMAAKQIAQAGLITTTSSNPDDKKVGTSIYQGDIVGSNSFNYSGYKRWLRGGDPSFKNGDVTVNMNFLGLPGSIMGMYGEKYDKMTNEDWEKQPYISNLGERFSGSFMNGLKNNVFGNTSTLFQALDGGNPYTINKWLRSSSNVLMNAFEPSWLSTASKIGDHYRVDYSAMGTTEQLAATVKERFFKGDDLPKQITVWGRKRTDVPEGINPYLYQYLDITKHRNVDVNDFGYNILALYNRTKDDSVIPSRPQKTIRKNNATVKLTPKQYEDFQIMVGTNRRQLTQALMSTPEYNQANDDEKIKRLSDVYKDAYQTGLLELEFKYFDLFKKSGVIPEDTYKEDIQDKIINAKP